MLVFYRDWRSCLEMEQKVWGHLGIALAFGLSIVVAAALNWDCLVPT